MTVLLVRDLKAGYAGVPVVLGVDLEVAAGEVLALLGPNGAGSVGPAATTVTINAASRSGPGLSSEGAERWPAVERALQLGEQLTASVTSR